MKLGKCESCALLREALAIERERVERLTGEVLTLRREGFQQPVKYQAGEKPTPMDPAVVEAIRTLSNDRGPMKATMLGEAGKLLARGEKPDAIVAHLWATHSALEPE